MEKHEVEKILKDSGAFLEGHFILTSGRHSDKYVQCAQLFKDSKLSEILCKELAAIFKDDNIDVVIGPAIGAILISYETSRHLGVPNLFTERVDGKMTLRRNFIVKPGQRVLVVEDVTTTGGSVFEVIECVKSLGGVVAGVGCIFDRTNGNIDFGVPFKSVYSTNVMSYSPEQCPLCQSGAEAAYKPGSRNLK
jgi:orotate phosphoribosyltransferase